MLDHEDNEMGLRYNEGKPQLSYIMSCDVAMTGLARVMEFGASKYERDNWKKGLEPLEIQDSLLRHLMAYTNGEVLDQESNLPHIDHVLFNAMALSTFGQRKEND